MREIAIKYGSAMAKYTPRTYVPCELHQRPEVKEPMMAFIIRNIFPNQLVWLSYAKVFSG